MRSREINSRSAIVEEGQAMDQANIINAGRKAGHTKYFNDNYELASLSRMKGPEVKHNVNQKLQKVLVNQHREGVFSY